MLIKLFVIFFFQKIKPSWLHIVSLIFFRIQKFKEKDKLIINLQKYVTT